MTYLIIFFGVLFFVFGIISMIKPAVILGFIEPNTDKAWIYFSAIIVRLLLGLLLIQVADVSRFPLVTAILGWLLLAAALFILLLGRPRFKRLIDRMMELFKPYFRLAGVFAAAFGAFLVYAFV
jgi:hypothetical protein